MRKVDTILKNEEWIKRVNEGVPDEGSFEITSYDDLHPGRFLKCGHLMGEPRTLTVTGYVGEKMGMKDGKPDVKGIIAFKEIRLQMTTNKTNEELLKAMFGDKPGDVVNKRVTVGPARDTYGGKMKDAIRFVGSPDITEVIEKTVKYAAKSGRKPSHHTLRPTVIQPDSPPKTPGDLTQVRTVLASAMPDTVDILLKPFRELHTWTADEGKEIKKRVEEIKSTTKEVSGV